MFGDAAALEVANAGAVEEVGGGGCWIYGFGDAGALSCCCCIGR